MLASAIRSIFKKLKECGRCKTGLRLSESLFLFLFFYRSSVERYFVIGGFRNPLLLFERLSSSLSRRWSIRFAYSPVRFAIRFFHGYLASSEGSAVRGSGWNESGSTSRMRFWLQLFFFFCTGTIYEEISNLLYRLLFWRIFCRTRNVWLERIILYNWYLEYFDRTIIIIVCWIICFTDIIRLTRCFCVYFRFFFFFVRTRGWSNSIR